MHTVLGSIADVVSVVSDFSVTLRCSQTEVSEEVTEQINKMWRNVTARADSFLLKVFLFVFPEDC